MPLARIVTRSYDEASPLAERLRQYGYTVEIFSPDQLRLSDADLEIELEVVPIEKALKVAAGRARKHEADVFVDRGVYSEVPSPPANAGPEVIQEPEPPVEPEAAVQNHVPPSSPPAEAAAETSSGAEAEAPQVPQEHIAEVVEDVLAEVGGAMAEARQGIAESWQHTREHAGSAVSRLAGKFAEARARRAAEREEQHRIREQEEELRRQERETEKARRAVEAEQARRAAAEERRLREQELGLRRQREEEERRRLIAEQQRLAAERAAEAEENRRRFEEQQRLAAERAAAEAEEHRRRFEEQQRLAAERAAAEAERKVLPVPPQPATQTRDVDPVAAEMEARAAVERRPRPRPAVRVRPRPVVSRRQRQWQRAALFASIVALVIMTGFALAMRQETPFSPSSKLLPAGAVQEQVPFGPASAAPQQVMPAPVRVTTPQQRSAPRPATPRRERNRDSGVAQDEVIIHHYAPRHPAAAKASTTAGVRHYSDMDNQR